MMLVNASRTGTLSSAAWRGLSAPFLPHEHVASLNPFLTRELYLEQLPHVSPNWRRVLEHALSFTEFSLLRKKNDSGKQQKKLNYPRST
jgi:hypothetical protein